MESEVNLVEYCNLFCYGSAEIDQFDLEKDPKVSKKPIIQVFSFGCNDDCAIGRNGDPEKPETVPLEIPIDMISAGDSHSVAANSKYSIIFFWGAYRNTYSGNMNKIQNPTRIGKKEFKGIKIKKMLSGHNHTLILGNNTKVYVWGDCDTCVLGRMPTVKRKLKQSLQIESIGKTGVLDVFTAGNHSFMKVLHKKRKNPNEENIIYYSWGLNNFGQLGLGNTENTFTPQEIIEFRNKNIIDIKGGSHHTVAVDDEGNLYTWGKNDEGQCGVENGKEINETPILVQNIANVKQIFCGENYNYAKTEKNQFYSWGFADNYVLATLNEDEMRVPTQINPQFFNFMNCTENNISHVGLGAQHVVLVVKKTDEDIIFQESIYTLPEELLKNYDYKTPKTGKNKKIINSEDINNFLSPNTNENKISNNNTSNNKISNIESSNDKNYTITSFDSDNKKGKSKSKAKSKSKSKSASKKKIIKTKKLANEFEEKIIEEEENEKNEETNEKKHKNNNKNELDKNLNEISNPNLKRKMDSDDDNLLSLENVKGSLKLIKND